MADDEENSDFGELPQPEDDATDERGIAKRHTDHRLQTLLTSEGLQKRLLAMFYDAKTFEEEQGVNILYIAIGMLKWFEDDNSEAERYAPLILVPVKLERSNAAERFRVSWRNEEFAANLSLQAKMKSEFELVIPDPPEGDTLNVSAYMRAVEDAIAPQKRFAVLENEMVLGFFSFAKFLMYRDLDPANWPSNTKLDEHTLITGLMCDGFPSAEGMIGEEENVDQHLTPAQMLHVVDADASQTLAIEESRRGRNLVIQGPPGTGKSQTITNIIAAAVADGKKVLFLAEKMAALEVVHRRMENIGLGPLCLELHSQKANKRSVLEELKRTKELGRPRAQVGNQIPARLDGLRARLNAHATMLHTPHDPSGLTAFQIMGHLVRLRHDGVDARGILLETPERWSADEKHERQAILSDVVERIKEIGIPVRHPWCGTRRSALLPNEYDRLCDDLAEVQQLYEALMKDMSVVGNHFPILDISLNSLHLGNVTAQMAAALPKADYPTLAHPLWQTSVPQLAEMTQSGERYAELKHRLANVVADAAWKADLSECRRQLVIHGRSLLRFLKPGYRQSIALLNSYLVTPMPKTLGERIALVDAIMTMQALERFLQEQNGIGCSAFGQLWQGLKSDWRELNAVVDWRKNLPSDKLTSDFLARCSTVTAPADWEGIANRLKQQVSEFFSKLEKLFRNLQLDTQVAFGAERPEAIRHEAFAGRLGRWIDDTETLSKWISFQSRYDTLCAKGVHSLAQKLFSGEMPVDKAQGALDLAYFNALAEAVLTAHSPLREFDGDEHNLLVADFRESDLHAIEQTRIAVRLRHYDDMPHSDGGIGALGVLNGEFAKKRNHLPIRQLIKRTGPAMQALKPVFMMSPLSVAQFLEPGALQFDLLVMDEASQVEPVDALGAIARAKQIVVVGDEHQLPPTRFFSRMTGNADDDTEDEENIVAADDVESILNLCLARGLPQRMLRWHYRSRHQSLIAVSNREFYESKLFIVPSPYDAVSGMGLKFNHLPDAAFDSGGTATNPVEAKAVAGAIIRHAKGQPELSLGVGAFSIKQRQAILDQLELLRRANPETEHFFTQAHRDEPFFVKNLENIQGDERDVILISVGYGRNASGYMAMRFGPLSAEGGERRLNVLISRAKRRCEVFSSITADDIDLERAKGAGVAALKLFLKFAETGKLDFGRLSSREADSVFEEQVAVALRARGYDVKTQVGIAGFFIDIAVVDHEKRGRFLLGIECDGAAYHSSRSARDRDRLRQAVLEDHGWIIHRIWSTDWFQRPKEQLEKTATAIEAARKALAACREKAETSAPPHPVFEIVSRHGDDSVTLEINVSARGLSAPYQEALLPVPRHLEPHEISDLEMAGIVSKIVEAEGPIHESEVIARVRILWNLARAGGRIQSKVKAGLAVAGKQGTVLQDGNFFLKPGGEIHVRDRSLASSASLRRPECLPPHEIKKAVLALVAINFGAGREQLPIEVAHLLGFKSTSAQIREVIDFQIQELLNTGKLQKTGEQLTLRDAAKMA